MEMTFPSGGLRQNQRTVRSDCRAILAQANARQSLSRTVRLVRQAELAPLPGGDATERRIHYFAEKNKRNMAVCGAFCSDSTQSQNPEFAVYQDASVNLKHVGSEQETTGASPTLRGKEHRGRYD